MKITTWIQVALVLMATVFIQASCGTSKESAQPMPVEAPAANQETQSEQPKNDNKKMNAHVKIHTSHGDMLVKLYDETPLHRDNFLKLVGEGYYNDQLFHRCISGFMAQGGDPNSKNAAPNAQLGVGGPGYTVPAEFNPLFVHKKGALAAARQGDQINPQRASSGSQFYLVQGKPLSDAEITQYEMYVGRKTPGFRYSEEQRNTYKTIGGTPMLDMDYTVFGEIVEGLDVVDKILSQPTKSGDRPVTDIKMTMEIVKK